jgi:hypothetical protein
MPKPITITWLSVFYFHCSQYFIALATSYS